LIRGPILYAEALERGTINAEEDAFDFLQGDVISTSAAYSLGERIENAKYVIANSSCDLVRGRRSESHVLLIPIFHIQTSNPNHSSILGEVLSFKSTQRMYIPKLPDDPDDALGNFIAFDRMATISVGALGVALRHASLSLVGWRIFASLLRNVMTRAGDSEIALRTQVVEDVLENQQRTHRESLEARQALADQAQELGLDD
jgi:hypothetical protein